MHWARDLPRRIWHILFGHTTLPITVKGAWKGETVYWYDVCRCGTVVSSITYT